MFFDHIMFYQQFRMTHEQYENLFQLVAPKLLKSSQKKEAKEAVE